MYKVIIIDDEETTRSGLKKHINWKQYGFEVVTCAENGYDALEKIQHHKPQLALCDIKMAQMDGIELGHLINEKYPECKIIYLSGYTNQQNLRHALRLRALDFFDKPIDIDAFHKRLQIVKSELDENYSNKKISANDKSVDLLTQELLFEILKNNNPDKEKIEHISKAINSKLDVNVKSFVVLHNKSKTLLNTLTDLLNQSTENKKVILNAQFDGISYMLIQGATLKPSELKQKLTKDDFVVIGSKHDNIFKIRNEIPYMLRVFKAYKEKQKERLIFIEDINEANIVLEVKQILNDFFSEDLSIKEISEYVYLSPQYLCNLYKKESGKTINDDLTDIRLEEAKKLLEDKSYKIYEVSKMVGYNDSSYFSRLFKKKFKLSPSEYRDSI